MKNLPHMAVAPVTLAACQTLATGAQPKPTTNNKLGGQERIRTSEVERQRIYSPPHLAALEPAHFKNLSHLSESNQRPTDYKSVALPAELKWQLTFI